MDITLNQELMLVRPQIRGLSVDTLEEYESKSSVPMSLGLVHCFCDPSRTKRAKLNIQQENEIRARAFLNDWSEDKIIEKINSEHRKREKYWIDKIQSLNKWPMLFVCGANHVEEFSELLKASGVDVLVECADWEPVTK